VATYRVNVQPDVLVWARWQVGLSVESAAEKLGVSQVNLRAWEVGADEISRPTIVQLRKMAKLYHVPLPALYLPEPPIKLSVPVVDFRLRIPQQNRPWSIELFDLYHRVQKQREVEIELHGEDYRSPERPQIELTTQQDAEELGDVIRGWLEIDLSTQLGWNSQWEALRSWSSAIESKDILVTHSAGVDSAEMRGFSIGERPFPAIVLNGGETPRARVFTLLHELVHVLLFKSGICNMRETKQSVNNPSSIETFCNRVAGVVLLPREEMLFAVDQMFGTQTPIWSDTALATLSHKYNVSREVVLRRMVSIGKGSLDDYFLKVKRYNQEYRIAKEREKEERERRKLLGLPPRSGPKPAVLKIRNFGRKYTNDVFVAYGEREISLFELADYLETRIESLPNIHSELEKIR
jgi:Zn-dependent peptidase ImmA (M78 family)